MIFFQVHLFLLSLVNKEKIFLCQCFDKQLRQSTAGDNPPRDTQPKQTRCQVVHKAGSLLTTFPEDASKDTR